MTNTFKDSSIHHKHIIFDNWLQIIKLKHAFVCALCLYDGFEESEIILDKSNFENQMFWHL